MKWIIPALTVALILIINIARFIDIADIPAGYHVDEFSTAVTTRCFGLEGKDAWGGKGGTFFSVAYGSPRPGIYIWFAALIGKIFGFTVPVLRVITALMVTLGVVAIFLIGRKLGGLTAGLFAGLSASLAPHIFVMSRVGYESMLAAVFTAWAFYFLLKAQRSRFMAAAAVCVSLSAYCYPPARLFLPLFLIAYFIIFKGWMIGRKPWIVFLLTLLVASTPLIHASLTDEALSRRFKEISIVNAVTSPVLSPEWFKNVFIVLWHNYGLHLSSQFLFLKGDASAVHSTTHHGLFSYLDYMAWALGLMLLVLAFFDKRRGELFKDQRRALLFLALCFLISIIPSALTTTEIPNALRISLHWPFTSLLTGILIAQAQKRLSLATAVSLVMAGIFAISFLSFYFSQYRKISAGMFNDWVVNDAEKIKSSEDWFKFLVKYRYKDYHTRYFLMNKQGKGCMESFEIWNNVYNNLGQGKRY